MGGFILDGSRYSRPYIIKLVLLFSMKELYMSHIRRLIQILLSLVSVFSLALALIQLGPAAAQGKDGIKRQYDPETGKVNFLSTANERPVAAAQALGFTPGPSADPALAIARHFGREFGLKDPAHELNALRTDRAQNGRLTVHYRQSYQGVPVLAGELIVNTNDTGDFYSMNGEVALDLSL